MMRPFFYVNLIAAALAADPWINEPDTGLDAYIFSTNYTAGSLPPLRDIRGVPDFDWAAEQGLKLRQYSFYQTAAAGEWSMFPSLTICDETKRTCTRLPKQPRYLV